MLNAPATPRATWRTPRPGDNKLPPNGNNPCRPPFPAIWSGYLEAPENGFYNLSIEADAGAAVTLDPRRRDGRASARRVAAPCGATRRPSNCVAGTLYAIILTVEKVKDTLSVRWETAGRGREIIPPRYLYSATLTDQLRAAYVRFLKAASLATSLRLTAAEIAPLRVTRRILGSAARDGSTACRSPGTPMTTRRKRC